MTVRNEERQPKVQSESLFERLLSHSNYMKLHAKLTPQFKEEHKQFFPEYEDANGNKDKSHIQGRKWYSF